MLSEIGQPQETKAAWPHLYVDSKTIKLRKQGVEWRLPEDGGWENGEVILEG